MKRWILAAMVVGGMWLGSGRVSAQYCASSISLDDYRCQPNALGTDCSWVYQGRRSSRSCSMQGADCLTDSPYCTSNDDPSSCLPAIGSRGSLFCLTINSRCSKAQCWVNPPTPTVGLGTPAPTSPPGPAFDDVAVAVQLFDDADGDGWRDPGEGIVEDSAFRVRIQTTATDHTFDYANITFANGGVPNTGLFSVGVGSGVSCANEVGCEGAGTYSIGSGRCYCQSGQAWSTSWSSGGNYNQGFSLGNRMGGYIVNTQRYACSHSSLVQIIPPAGWSVTGGLEWVGGTHWRRTDSIAGGRNDTWSGALVSRQPTASTTCGVTPRVTFRPLMFGVRRTPAPTGKMEVACGNPAGETKTGISRIVTNTISKTAGYSLEMVRNSLFPDEQPGSTDAAIGQWIRGNGGSSWVSYMNQRWYMVGTDDLSWGNVDYTNSTDYVQTREMTESTTIGGISSGATLGGLMEMLHARGEGGHELRMDVVAAYSGGERSNGLAARTFNLSRPPIYIGYTVASYEASTYTADVRVLYGTFNGSINGAVSTRSDLAQAGCAGASAGDFCVSINGNGSASNWSQYQLETNYETFTVANIPYGQQVYVYVDDDVSSDTANETGSCPSLQSFAGEAAPPTADLTVQAYLDNSLSCANGLTEGAPVGNLTVERSSSSETQTFGPYSSSNYQDRRNVNQGTWIYSGGNVGGYELLSCSKESVNVNGTDDNSDGLVDTMRLWFAQKLGPWWQTEGGDVLANGGGVSSNIPDSAEADRRFISDDGTQESGVVLASGGVSPQDGQASEGDNWVADNTTGMSGQPYDVGFRRENYCYFWRLFEMPGTCDGSGAEDDWSAAGTWGRDMPQIDTLWGQTPANSPPGGWSNNTKVYYYDAMRHGNQPLQLNGSGATGEFTVNAGRRVVVFVNGDVYLTNYSDSSQTVSVDAASDSFLAIIATGDIRFSATVGESTQGVDPATFGGSEGRAAVEGVFVSDGRIYVASNSGADPYRQFVGEGVFVGWGGVVMERDLDGANNNLYPAHIFRYRPDLAVNAPEEFLRVQYEWDEIAPRDL